MKISFPRAAACILGLLVPAVLCIPALLAGGGAYRRQFLAVPAELGSPRIGVEKTEQFCEDEFPVTYEIPSAARAALPHAEYPVTLIATNSVYPRILGLPMAGGAFFSKSAWEGKQRHLVLNEEAAFRIFGTLRAAGQRLKIRGETWLVCGVIRDGDDERSRVYVPSSVQGGEASALMALLEPERGITGTYKKDVKNGLSALGLREGPFEFFNLDTYRRLLWERAAAACGTFLCLMILLLLPPLGKSTGALYTKLKGDLKKQYPRELFLSRRKELLTLAFRLLTLAALLGLFLFLVIRLVSLCLPWQDLPSLARLDRDLFYPGLDRLCAYDFVSRLLFGLGMGGMGLGFVVLIHFNRRTDQLRKLRHHLS